MEFYWRLELAIFTTSTLAAIETRPALFTPVRGYVSGCPILFANRFAFDDLLSSGLAGSLAGNIFLVPRLWNESGICNSAFPPDNLPFYVKQFIPLIEMVPTAFLPRKTKSMIRQI